MRSGKLSSQSRSLVRSKTSAEQTVVVDLAERSYDILIKPGLLGRIGEEISARTTRNSAERTAVVVTNPKVDLYHGPAVYASLESSGFRVVKVLLTAGEAYKTLNTVKRIYKTLHSEAVDRGGVVVALGGGVIGDVAGFAAATYNRGIDLVQVPTTLLAQVDSSVGGKTGVNFGQGKNLIGSFHQPKLVTIDTDTLKSLPMRERRSGLVEMVKYGLIYDPDFFALLSPEILKLLRLNSPYLGYAIARACEIKARIVEQDETESGIRAILNFGHTIGHALEAATKYRVYRHGEAIAVGIVTACLIGEELSITPPECTSAVVGLFRTADFPTTIPASVSSEELIRLTAWDKKTVGGEARYVLLDALGSANHGHRVDTSVVRDAISRQRQLE